MRIAVIADIHGNMPALEAVVQDIAEQAVDEVLVGGDLVGRGPEGRLVCRRIRELGWLSVRGNHEDYLLEFARGNIPEAWKTDQEWSAARFMSDELSEEDLTYLDSLPHSLVSQLAPELRLVHGTPRSNNDGIGPWTTRSKIEDHFSQVAEPLLVCCHTHRPLLEEVEEGWVANPGSVGLPFNGDTRAQYAIFACTGSGWETVFRQVEYDVEEVLSIYRSSGFEQQGGITAKFLRLELQYALPFLVPFLSWAGFVGRPPHDDAFEDFMAVYEPGTSLRDFFSKLTRS